MSEFDTAAGTPEFERVTQALAAVQVPQEEAAVVEERLAETGVFDHQAQRLTDLAAGDSMIQSVPGPVPAGVHDLLAARFTQERVARRAAEQELESARRLIGQGPFVIVKIGSVEDLEIGKEVTVKIGFGGGVTRDVIRSVLSLGQQAVADEAEPSHRGEQGDTVRLPERVDRPRCDGYCSGQYEDPDCSWHGRPRRPAEKPQEGNYGPGQPRVPGTPS